MPTNRPLLRLLCLLTVCCGIAGSVSAEELRYVLSSVADNVDLEDFDLNAVAPQGISAHWNVRQQVLRGGRQTGVRVITLDNGRIRVTVVPTRGMSIFDVRDAKTGQRLFGWDSPVKEVVHPQFVDLESRGGLGWLEGFNEWMVRCGLEYAGHPGQDKFITNTGDEGELNLTLHGKIGNIPATDVELRIDDAPPHRLRLIGTVYERMFYGPKLKLVTELSLLPGSATLSLRDAVTNQGAAEQEYQLIYHANFGAPLLQAGARVVVPVDEISPMNAQAAKSLAEFDRYAGPETGFIEQVYLIKPRTDSEGRTSVLLKNAAGDQGARVDWSTGTLPYLTIWKNTAATADGYVTGIEPATGYPFNRRIERHYGRVPKLAPGETRNFDVEVSFLESAAKVQEAEQDVRRLQGDRPAVVHPEPPKNPFAE